MSSYGPPDGPYPGQPQDPWHAGQPREPEGQPGGSWGPDNPWSGAPSSGGPSYGSPYGQERYGQPYQSPGQYGPPQPEYGQPQQPDYGPPQPDYGAQQPTYQQPAYGGEQPGYGGENWGAPPPPPSRRRPGLIVILVVVLAVLLCGGGATAVYLVTKGNGKSTAGGSTGKSTPTAHAPTAAPSQPPSQQATPDQTGGANDALTAQVGDCLVNEGTNDQPKMRKVSCGKGTFEVLKRFDATTDKSKCDGIPGYTHNYFYDSSVDANDFVLCLKQRTQ
jgi:hypothetical protein